MKPEPNGICRKACAAQNHETFWDCQMDASFDAGWTNALMQLDMWIRSTMKTPGTQVQAVRAELLTMANDVYTGLLPSAIEYRELIKRSK